MKLRDNTQKEDYRPCLIRLYSSTRKFIKGQLKELVRGSGEETLNELLEKEAETLTQAARYERKLATTSGDVTLHMPRVCEEISVNRISCDRIYV